MSENLIPVRFERPYPVAGRVVAPPYDTELPEAEVVELEKTKPPTVVRIAAVPAESTEAPAAPPPVLEVAAPEPEPEYSTTDGTVTAPAAAPAEAEPEKSSSRSRPRQSA